MLTVYLYTVIDVYKLPLYSILVSPFLTLLFPLSLSYLYLKWTFYNHCIQFDNRVYKPRVQNCCGKHTDFFAFGINCLKITSSLLVEKRLTINSFGNNRSCIQRWIHLDTILAMLLTCKVLRDCIFKVSIEEVIFRAAKPGNFQINISCLDIALSYWFCSTNESDRSKKAWSMYLGESLLQSRKGAAWIETSWKIGHAHGASTRIYFIYLLFTESEFLSFFFVLW